MTDIDIAAMYGNHDTTPDPAPIRPDGEPKPDRGILSMPAMSARLRELQTLTAEQARLIRRLSARLSHLEAAVRKHGRALQETETELGHKLDLRG